MNQQEWIGILNQSTVANQLHCKELAQAQAAGEDLSAGTNVFGSNGRSDGAKTD